MKHKFDIDEIVQINNTEDKIYHGCIAKVVGVEKWYNEINKDHFSYWVILENHKINKEKINKLNQIPNVKINNFMTCPGLQRGFNENELKKYIKKSK